MWLIVKGTREREREKKKKGGKQEIREEGWAFFLFLQNYTETICN